MTNKTTTQIPYKVVTLSSIPARRPLGLTTTKTSRYSDAINAAAKYTKRAVLLNLPNVTTPKQAMVARYGVLSAIRSRKLHKTLEIVQRGSQLFIRRVAKNATTNNTVTA